MDGRQGDALIVTIYSGARGRVPADVADVTWDELADELEALANAPSAAPEGATTEEQKRCMTAWAPHELATPIRKKANVTQVTCLALDVDAGDPDDVAARLYENGIAAVLYASPSDGPPLALDRRRFRVVSPVVEAIDPDDARATRIAFAEALGLDPGCGVEVCGDPSRIFFAGRLHGTPERQTWRVEGEPVDVAALPVPRLKWGAGKASAVDLAPLRELPPADLGIAAALGDYNLHDGRKWDLCGAVGGLMRKLGYRADQCEAELRAWLPPDDPRVDVHAGVAWALAAWRHAPEDVSGHAALADLLGAEHADVVERAAMGGTVLGKWIARREAKRAPRPFAETWTRPVTGGANVDPLGERAYLAGDDEPIPYYCDALRLAPSKGKVSLIGGLPGAGKGPLANHLAACFASGAPVFGEFAVRKAPTLLLDCEGVRLSKRRIRRMARPLGLNCAELDSTLEIRDVAGMDLLSDRAFAAIQATGAEVVVLDSYTSAMLPTGADPNKIEFASLAQMLGALGLLVLVVAHARKPPSGTHGERPTLADVAGSFALASLAATGISVWRPDDEQDSRIRIGCMRAPETSFASFDVEFQDVAGDGLRLEAFTIEDDRKRQAAAQRDALALCAERVVEWMRTTGKVGNFALRAFHGITGFADTTNASVLAALVRADVLVCEQDPRGKAGALYRLRDAQGGPRRFTFDDGGTCKPALDVVAVGGFVRGRG